jgi:hypothetical protein
MPEKTVRIAFRGLMVFNYQTDAAGKKFMEIGFLDARTDPEAGADHTATHSHVHVPRVLTTENGVLADILDLRTRPELLGTVRRWELRATNPTQTEATLKGGVVNRQNLPTDANREDFNWIVDLEGRDMHDQGLTSQISTARLLMVLTVRTGEFCTRLISPFLNREEKGVMTTTPFGYSAAVTGVDIKCNVANADDEGIVDLIAGGTQGTLVKRLQSKKGRNTVFEIANTPPDVPTDAPLAVSARSHFRMYYEKLFIQSPPNRQFDFIALGGAPSPDPALCGVTLLGQRDDGI